MIDVQSLKLVLGETPPPYPGTHASIDLMDGSTAVLRCTARSVGLNWNQAKVDVLTASSLLPTQRDLRVRTCAFSTYYTNVDVSLLIDNTQSVHDSAVDGTGEPDNYPMVSLEKLASGVPDVTTVNLSGGRDATTSLNLSKLIAYVNAEHETMYNYVSFLSAFPSIGRAGSWGNLYWPLPPGLTQGDWENTVLSQLAAILNA
jgi:hypothetical protein